MASAAGGGYISFVGPWIRQAHHKFDVPGYPFDFAQEPCGQAGGGDRDVLKLRPGITGPATLKYRLEDEMISDYVAKKQAEGDT